MSTQPGTSRRRLLRPSTRPARAAPSTSRPGSYIRPAYAPYFDGDALIVIDPAPVEGDYHKSAYRGGPRLYGLVSSP